MTSSGRSRAVDDDDKTKHLNNGFQNKDELFNLKSPKT